MKQAKIYMYSNFAGILTEDENGYRFIYNPEYLLSKDAEPISLTMPLTDKPYISNILHPFFDGLKLTFIRDVQKKYLEQLYLLFFLIVKPISNR